MVLIGEVSIEAPRERVWEALNDPAVLQCCIPGCEEVVNESPTVRRARVMVKVGPVRARFNGRVTLSEIDPPQRCVMSFEGSGGAAGMASGRSQVELHEQDGGTRLTYTVKASVGGKLGQIGGRMMDASAKQLADQFFEALRAMLAPVAQPLPAAPAELHGLAVSGPGATTRSPTTVADSAAQVAAAPAVRLPPVEQTGFPSLSERTRVLWFLLGAGATALGVWLGTLLR